MITCSQWWLEAVLTRLLQEDWLAGDSWYLALFVNDFIPYPGQLPADFTEPAGSWYVRKFLNRATWSSPSWTSPTASSLYGVAPQTWAVTGSTAVLYGYYVLDTLGDRVVYAERFESPISVPASNTLDVWPRYSESTFCVCATP